MGARLSTSPLPALADPGRSQPLPPRGAPRGTSPPLRSSQPPVSRKLTPRASSRAARWGCRLRDLHGLGLRKDQHASRDLLHPSLDEEKKKHKKKRLVQSPNSYFMDVKCPGCYKITTVFSHAQTVVLCVGCSTVLCQPTGGKARLTEGCSFRRKQH
ncbi:PREDICTED: 40S ribosomal protein S27-like isoform X1 [Bison bison bison]|uniref:40S ribosomal protein S27 n=1 Tax=Bison bison bison TaxID=43346 RepID=A0A6P3GJM7_BISBB|nr:PREDICTED: 40S ribosomal protein S27-like isoform X1 [Bison bison bison]